MSEYDDGYGDDEFSEMEHEGVTWDETLERMEADSADEDDPHTGDGVHEAVCAICHADLSGDWESCDRCVAPVCRVCSVPGVDEHGNLIALCLECESESSSEVE